MKAHRNPRRSASRHGCGAGIRCRKNADCLWSLFSMRHRLESRLDELEAIRAEKMASTFATPTAAPVN